MPFYYGALFFALLGLAKLVYRRSVPSKPAKAPVSALGSDLRHTIQHGTPILTPETPGMASHVLSDDAIRARIEAAMANPKIAVRDIGQTVPAPKPAAEMFTVPDAAYASRTGSSANVSTPSLAERVRLALASARAPQIVAYAGLAALMLMIAAMMGGGTASFGQMPSVEDNLALAKSLLPWLGGLIVVLVLFKKISTNIGTSKRKSVYDPYVRLAERERTRQDRSGSR